MSMTQTPSLPELRHHIGADYSAHGELFEIVDPSAGAVIGSAPIATVEDVDRAVDAATEAARTWGRSTPAERATALLALADAVDANGERLAALESLDVGKPITFARDEMPGISDTLRYYAGAARMPHGTSTGTFAEKMHSRVHREPVGVVGLIAPWNYPLLEAVWKIAPALAAGNTLVLKPSELTPLTTTVLFELAREIFPPGVLNLVLGDASTGKALVAHPGIQMVSLTGDVSTGKKVAQAAADSLKRVHLELGGKAPVLVLPDADLDATVEYLVQAGFINTGQDCTAACRVIVHDAVYDEFSRRYLDRVSTVVTGAGLDETTTMGPLISGRQRERAMGFVERARADGAEIAVGGDRPDLTGEFMSPTVVLGAAQDSEIVQHEVFGPVVTLQRAASEEQMIDWANDVQYGLSASVWTDDVHAVERTTRALNFGTVWVNTHLWTVPEAPFGGFGGSGYGKEMSAMSLDDYSRFKHVLLQER